MTYAESLAIQLLKKKLVRNDTIILDMSKILDIAYYRCNIILGLINFSN